MVIQGQARGGRVTAIASRDNPRFKTWVQLLSARGIKRHGCAVVSGRKIVPELMARPAAQTMLLAPGMAPPPGLPENLPRTVLSADLFAVLDELGTHYPLLVVEAAVPPPWPREVGSGLTLAVAAQDPANLGSILRSAAGLGAARAVLLAECAHPFLPRVTRAAAGANFDLPLLGGPAIAEMPDFAIALDMAGESLVTADLPRDMVLLLGEEGGGLPVTFGGRRLAIPLAGGIDSLNVAVSAGIALAEYRRRHPFDTEGALQGGTGARSHEL